MFVYEVRFSVLTFVKVSVRDDQLYFTLCCIEFVQLSPINTICINAVSWTTVEIILTLLKASYCHEN